MNKYTILILLNAPLAIYAMLSILLSYKLKRLRPSQATIRLIFWGLILGGICFAKPLTEALARANLTDTPPLSIFDVFIATGVMISLLMAARTHGRNAELENKFTALHERLSIITSDPNRSKRK